MVYPVEVVTAILDPGDVACQEMTATDTGCTAVIRKDDLYRVHISRANKLGLTIDDEFTFDCEFFMP